MKNTNWCIPVLEKDLVFGRKFLGAFKKF